jgi:transposase InsO family protein
MVDSFLEKQRRKENGYTATQCFKMFGVSDSGYYAWKARQLDKDGKQAAKRRERNDIKEKMRQIVIARNGVIPGKRTFRAELFRRYGLTVNVKRIAALMKEMHLVAQRPHKDAYKHQASHNHVCVAPANEVDQDFFIGPRRVILTDITYLYYGPCRDTFYLCVFRDAYTRENLGWDIGLNMTVGLVKNAYGRMLGEHGDELNRNASVYVHHDQGSQYLSTTFKELLEDDGFIQSVSARGNSHDNAPMESFFGRLKTAILDMVARCRTFDDAKELVSGYIKAYNTEHYQYDLAALTPAEFYQYATTGIYPLDNYFGVPASVMMTNGDLKKVRRRYADDEAKKRRKTAARKREGKRLIDPLRIINRDQKLLDRFIRKWEESKETATTQIAHLREIVEKVRKALDFIAALPSEKYEELKDPLIWRNYEQLGYVFEMNELF